MTRTVAEKALQLLTRSVEDVAGHEERIADALVNALHAGPRAPGLIAPSVPGMGRFDVPDPDLRAVFVQPAVAVAAVPHGATLH